MTEWVGKIDLLISCGDLPPGYLDFLVTNLSAPMVHVIGNHCLALHDVQKCCSPEAYPGVYNLNKRVTSVKLEDDSAVIIAGLEGSPWYNNGPHQYTDTQVRFALSKLVPRLLFNKARRGRYLDIMVTHSPPRGIHDNTDKVHIGFKSLLSFINRFEPTLLLHGHTHRYDPTLPIQTHYRGTQVVNAYGHVFLELVEREDGRGWQLKQ